MNKNFLNILLLWVVLVMFFANGTRAVAEYAGFSDPGSRQAGGAGGPGGGLMPVQEVIDGGKIPIGATAQVVVRFRNDGSQPVNTGLIRLYPSSTVSANVALNQCEEEPLASGAECAVALSVKGLQAGAWRLEMLMSHSGRTRLVTATLSGNVETTGTDADKLTSDVQTIPDKVEFGMLESSQTLTEPVTLRNITSTPIDIQDIYIDSKDSAGYSLKADCKKLDPGQACIAVVTWAPQQRGRSSGVLVIRHSGPAAISSVPLTGEYKPEDVAEADIFPQAVPGRGLLVSSLTELDFGADVQTASTTTVSLVNAGDSDLTIKDIQIAGADNGLSFKESGCAKGTVLEPIEACPLTVTWSPTRVGALADAIQVLHDGARGVLVMPVKGESTASVSQDQKAILLSDNAIQLPAATSKPADPAAPAGTPSVEAEKPPVTYASFKPQVNPATVLDGYKITSFSPTRAIINGPGGSRIVFDNEEIVLGGVPWFVVIQKNGIEFLYEGSRILLLFDRSLSSINRISASSDKGSKATGETKSESSSGTGTASSTSEGTNG